MTQRGIGIAGALDRQIVGELAEAAEHAGYATFWANDTDEGDGLDALRAAVASTRKIRFGVGVIPIDRVAPAEIVRRIKQYELPEERLTIGIGSGGLGRGALAAVEGAATQLRGQTRARIVIGALGPKMVALSGKAADGALLNWLTPDHAREMTELMRTSAPNAWVGAYVRVGLSGAGERRVAAEGDRYASFPSYKANFDRMGAAPLETCAHGEPEAVQARLSAFDQAGLDETIVRAIAATETLTDYLEVLKAAAPHG